MTGIRMRTLLVVYYKPCVLYISTCHYIALASHQRCPVVSFVKLNACDIFTGRRIALNCVLVVFWTISDGLRNSLRQCLRDRNERHNERTSTALLMQPRWPTYNTKPYFRENMRAHTTIPMPQALPAGVVKAKKTEFVDGL